MADCCKPNETFEALKKLDEQGRLKACITTNTHGLEREAGIGKVVELYGSRNVNWCTKCGKHFSVDYIRQSKGVPLCD